MDAVLQISAADSDPGHQGALRSLTLEFEHPDDIDDDESEFAIRLAFSSIVREILRAVAVHDGGAGLEHMCVCLMDEMVDFEQAYASMVLLLQVSTRYHCRARVVKADDCFAPPSSSSFRRSI
jgi:hypothetical protein